MVLNIWVLIIYLRFFLFFLDLLGLFLIFLNSLGCYLIFLFVFKVVFLCWVFLIFVFLLVVSLWLCFLIVWVVLVYSFWDFCFFCFLSGWFRGGLCFDFVVLKNIFLWLVCRVLVLCIIVVFKIMYFDVFEKYFFVL